MANAERRQVAAAVARKSPGNIAFVRDRKAAARGGEQIAFSSNRTGDDEICNIRADSTRPINLTKSPASRDLQPAWRPLP